MNDILPPQKPAPQPPKQPKKEEILLEQPERPLLLEPPKPRSRFKIIMWVLVANIGVLLLAGVAGFAWYQGQLRPVDPNNTNKMRVTITGGSSPAVIGDMLEDKKLIRSSLAFDIYTRLTGVRSALQAGSYSLSPSESTQQIVTHLTSGKVDEFSITFFARCNAC